MYRRQIWEEVGGYDQSMRDGYEDWEFWINCLSHGAKVYTIPEILFSYRVRKASMLGALRNDPLKIQDNLAYIYAKHKELYQKYLVDVLKAKDRDLLYKDIVIKDLKEKDFNNKKFNRLEDISLRTDRNFDVVIGNNLVLSRIERLIDRMKNFIVDSKIARVISRIRKFTRGEGRYYRIEGQQHISEEIPVISVIIPCYNYGRLLPEAILSIQKQTWKRTEIIIIDDNSDDKTTQKILKEIQEMDSEIPIQVSRNSSNKGVVYSRNKGIGMAKGKYIICLDADDKLEKSYLEKCIWVFETMPEVGVVFSDLQMFGKENTIYPAGVFEPDHLKVHNQIFTASAFRKVCWEEVGGYKEEMKNAHEDWEFWLSISKTGWVGYKIPEPLFYYRKHSNESLSEKANKIDDVLKIKIRRLHPDIYTVDHYKPAGKQNKKKPKFQMAKFNNDKEINLKEKVVLLIVPNVGGGGAERFWMNYINEAEKYGYKFIIIGTIPAQDYVYSKLAQNVIGIFNLPNILDQKYWLDFISEQITKYSIEEIIISNSRYAYMNIGSLKLNPKIRIFDIIYNDSEYGCLDLSIEKDTFLDLHIVNNNKIKDHYREHFGISEKKVRFLPTPIDLEYFDSSLFDKSRIREKYSIYKDSFVFCYIGRMSPVKNLDLLVRSFAELIKSDERFDPVRLILAGEGGQKNELENLIESLNIGDNVNLFSFMDDPRELYAISDVFVQISQIEGMPPSIMEALAMGLPVIATDAGAKKEVLVEGENAYFVTKLDQQELTQELKKVLAKNWYRGESLKKYVKQFDIKKLGKELIEILKYRSS